MMSKQSSKLVDEIGQFAAIPNEFIESARTMSDPARWLFVLLRYYTNGKTGDAFPSYDELQEMTGWRRTKVSAAIKELVESGWITRQKRFGASTIYRLTRPSEVAQTQTEEAASSSPARTTDEIQKSTRPNYSSSPVRTALVRTGDTLTRLNELDRNNQMESASDATAPTPPASKPSRKKLTHKPTVVQTEPESPRAPSPPVTPEQAAANDAAFAALEAAPPEARQPMRASGTSKDAIERAIGDVCFRADRDLRRANMGDIRAWGKRIRETNADLETPITAELIYHVFEDSGYWQRHYMSLDETTNTRRLPTPGIVGKHTLNILAWGKGQTQAPPPPLVRYTAPPSPEPIFRRRTPAELEALRRQALEGLPEANYARTA